MKRRMNHKRVVRTGKTHPIRPGNRRLARQAEAEAQRITKRLIGLCEGDLHEPETWKQVAAGLSIRCFATTDFPGCYMRCDLQDSALIAVNDDLPPSVQSHVWVHELAHHLLYEAEPPLPMETTTHYYNDEAGGIAHKIACRVEKGVLGD